MKIIIFLCLFLSFAASAGQSVVRDAASTAIPAAFGDANSAILTNVRANRICCVSHVDDAIDLCWTSKLAASCGLDWYMEDNDGFCFDDDAMGSTLWVQGHGGAASVGVLSCRVWQRN